MKEKALQVIKNYGVLVQLKYLQSEVFELNESIINANTYDEFAQADMNVFHTNREYFIKHIAEELADVRFMLTQFQEYYGISDEQIEEIMNYKADRQLKRIEEAERCDKYEQALNEIREYAKYKMYTYGIKNNREQSEHILQIIDQVLGSSDDKEVYEL